MTAKKKLTVFEKRIIEFLLMMGGMTQFAIRFIKEVFFPPYEFLEIKKHMDELGVKTLPIVSITGFIIGVVLTLQSYPVMLRFGAESFLPNMVSLSVVRELGPVITALIFAGRVSSGIGAELGSMRVTEQIDAMEVSAINPFKYLVITRIVACTLILPLLTVYVIFIAILGGYLALILNQDMSFVFYTESVINTLRFTDVLPGVGKTLVFGFIVGLVGSFKGYTAENGTEGVGKASTSSVVVASLLILIVDMVLVQVTVTLWTY